MYSTGSMTNEMDVELLIQLVKVKPFLYNKTEKSYTDVAKRESAWKEIGIALNSTPDACEKMWNYLKQKFARVRKKYKAEPNGAGLIEISKWPWFEDLQFLDKCIRERMRRSFCGYKNINEKIMRKSVEEVQIKNTKDDDPTTTYSNNDSSEWYSEDASYNIDNLEKMVNQKMTEKSSTNKHEADHELDNKLVEAITNISKRPAEAAFGNLVAYELSQISNMTTRRKMKKKIMDIIYSCSDDS